MNHALNLVKRLVKAIESGAPCGWLKEQSVAFNPCDLKYFCEVQQKKWVDFVAFKLSEKFSYDFIGQGEKGNRSLSF